MQKYFRGTLILLSAVLLTSVAQAQETQEPTISRGGFFIEPLIAALSGSSEIKTSQLGLPDDTSGNTRGWGLGLKLGAHVSEIFFVGADVRYDHVTLSDSSYGKASADGFNYAPTAGVQMPILGLRLLGSYVVGGEFNPESGDQGVDVKFRDPHGWRVGAGIRLLAVSVNLEYQDLEYNKTDIQSFGVLPGTAASDVDFENRGYSLSVSFPIEL